MEMNEKMAFAAELFEETVANNGFVFESEESRNYSKEDFMKQYENGVENPKVRFLSETENVVSQEQANVEAPTSTVGGESNQQVSIEDSPIQPKASKKKLVKKDYKPNYNEETKAKLAEVTKVTEAEIERLAKDPAITTYAFGVDNSNLVIDITGARRNGIDIVTPKVNRAHGKDQESTGESLRTYGAQHLCLCITKSMADAAHMKVERFASDKSTASIGETALVILDGNGRIGYCMGLEMEEWPQMYATLPVKDALGYYNHPKVMETINTACTIWKTQDLVQKRQLEEGDSAHPAWSQINELVNKKGYKYQAACQTVTLGTDRIQKKTVNGGNTDAIFRHYKSAMQIHEALVERFGEGEDKTLITKEFTKEISILWQKLQSKSGDDKATTQFIKFVKELKENKVDAIKNAKNDKNGLKKDEIRKNILNDQFSQFIGREGIEID